MTLYVVLGKQDDEVGYLPIGREEATTDQGAIKKALAEVTEVWGEYVAVPARSWRPRKVEAEVKTQLTIK